MYKLPKSATLRVQGTRSVGRPQIYHIPTLPVSFRVPAKWREEGSEKAENRVNLTKLFAIYYLEFLDRPIEETQAFIDDWEKRHGPIVEIMHSDAIRQARRTRYTRPTKVR
jgi:hypothetical protein